MKVDLVTNSISPEDDLPSIGQVQHYYSLINEGNPDIEGSIALLRLFCARAKKLKFPTSPFPDQLTSLLITAFERYLSGEEKDLEKSLGLKRRGKPPSPEILKRNHLIAADVFRRSESGETKTPSRERDGIFYEVANKYKLSESEVRDIYYKYKNEGMAIVLLERFLD